MLPKEKKNVVLSTNRILKPKQNKTKQIHFLNKGFGEEARIAKRQLQDLKGAEPIRIDDKTETITFLIFVANLSSFRVSDRRLKLPTGANL